MEASSLLQQVLPVMLQFMADEYDDTCSTVFTMLQSVLAHVRVFLPIGIPCSHSCRCLSTNAVARRLTTLSQKTSVLSLSHYLESSYRR